MGFQVKSNLTLTLRERGKLVTQRKGHNIWLDVGREYLASLLCYSSFTPLVAEQNNRISYIGFGIGGTRQIYPSISNNEPLLSHYPGNNLCTDKDPKLLQLERPVRINWSVGPNPPDVGGPPYIYDSGDIWLKQAQSVTHPITTVAKYNFLISTTDLNGGYYLAMPLSEIGLFHRGVATNVYNNSPVAYDTFDTLQKTGSFDLTVSWTIRF